MKSLIACLGLFLALGTAAVAGSPANFAGTWELDRGKSEGLPRNMENADKVTWVVTQSEGKITVETNVVAGGEERPGQSFSYNLDGTETTAEVGGRVPGKAKTRAKWMGDGKILELATVRELNFQGNDVTIETTEHWELDADGTILKVHRTTESPQGTRESKLTFNKK